MLGGGFYSLPFTVVPCKTKRKHKTKPPHPTVKKFLSFDFSLILERPHRPTIANISSIPYFYNRFPINNSRILKGVIALSAQILLKARSLCSGPSTKKKTRN